MSTDEEPLVLWHNKRLCVVYPSNQHRLWISARFPLSKEPADNRDWTWIDVAPPREYELPAPAITDLVSLTHSVLGPGVLIRKGIRAFLLSGYSPETWHLKERTERET